MVKNLFIFFIILFEFSSLKAQEIEISIIKNFKGTIGNYPIHLQYYDVLHKDSVFCEYYYDKSGSENSLFLRGKKYRDSLKFKEQYYNGKRWNESGYFDLLISDYSLNGNWTNGKKIKILPTKLEIIEKKWNIVKDILVKANFYVGDCIYLNGNQKKCNKLNEIVLQSSNGNIIQRLQNFEDIIIEDKLEIIFEDMNFDGFLDMKILEYYTEASKQDFGYIYYLYEPNKAIWVKNKRMNEFRFLKFNSSSKQVINGDADGHGNDLTEYYEWFGDKLCLVKEVRLTEEGEMYVKTFFVKNGNSILTKEIKK